MTTFIPGLYTGVPRFEVFLDNPCRQSREEQPITALAIPLFTNDKQTFRFNRNG